MRNSVLSIILCFSLVIFEACHKDSAVTLAVDFTSRDCWNYEFSFDVGGNFSWNDSVSNLTSTVRCILTGHGSDESDHLDVKVKKVSITSNILDEAEIENITEQIKNAEYTIFLHDGFPTLDDSVIIPAAGFGEWDLYRQLVKVVPSLPEEPVRPGFSWERERQIPLATSHGAVTCNVYLSFTFDSLRTLSENRQEACISWLFRYTIDHKELDTASLIDELPLSGKGRGTAVLDVAAKSLVSAGMVFKTPVCALSDLSVSWEEKASLVLVDKVSSKEN